MSFGFNAKTFDQKFTVKPSKKEKFLKKRWANIRPSINTSPPVAPVPP